MQGKEALPAMQRAVELLPNDEVVHYNLGVAQKSAGQLDNAATSFRRAVALSRNFAEAYVNLGVVLQDLWQLEDAIASYRKAIKLKPDFAEAHFNLANTLRDSGQIDAALRSYRHTVELEPGYEKAHKGLGLALLLIGRYSDGWKEYSWRIRPSKVLNYPVRLPPENPLFGRRPDALLPPDLQGMRIVLLKDYGLGDELFFLRFSRELKRRGAWVAYMADPRIAALIRRTKLVDHVAVKGEVVGDAHAALLIGDLPLVLGMSSEADIPPPLPLEALPEKRQEIALRLASVPNKAERPLIGITWRAGAEMVREIPLEQLGAALRDMAAIFVVVQRNPQPGEIAAFEAALGQPVVDFSDLNDDLEGMMVLMEQLDDYIGVDNTNMHLRVGTGKIARILVPHLQDFRCMATGDSSPWFPGFAIYRRTPDRNWSDALKRLRNHVLH
jgi:Tfp pilus assembly protein PilF